MSSCLDSKGGRRRPSTLQFHFISIYNGFDVIFAYTSPRDIISSIFNVHVVRTCFERAKLIRCVCAILQIRNALIMMFNLSQGFFFNRLGVQTATSSWIYVCTGGSSGSGVFNQSVLAGVQSVCIAGAHPFQSLWLATRGRQQQQLLFHTWSPGVLEPLQGPGKYVCKAWESPIRKTIGAHSYIDTLYRMDLKSWSPSRYL